MYTVVFKRLLDIVVAFTLLLILSPLMIVIYLLLLVTEWENPIFSQERIGLNEKPFTLIKFKSMRTVTDERGNLLPSNLRITFVGGILRKTSLDELPQLLNVLKGDMSFIGPRPLFEMYLPYYTAQEQKRHTVRPGITGLAQVKGRNLISWDTKLAYDVEYVNNLSFKLDCEIFFKTIVNTLLTRGVLINDPANYLNEERKHVMAENNPSSI